MATYFTQRSKTRIQMRMAGPTYGPPGPYTFQKQPMRQDLRDPGPSRNPKFLEQRHGVTDYQRFRPGVSLPGYDPKLIKAMAHLGLGVLERNPWVRLARIGFNLAYDLDWINPYGIIKEGVSGYDMSGWTKCCEISPAGGAYRTVFSGQYTYPIGTPPRPGYEECAFSVNCGLNFQLPTDLEGADIVASGSLSTPQPGYYHRGVWTIFFGPYNPVIGRMEYHRKYATERRVYPGEAFAPVEIPYVQEAPVGMPLPHLTPPLPAIQIIDRPEPRVLPRVLPMDMRPMPYQRPAVSVEIKPGGRRQPPHIPPKLEYHDQLPPLPGEREKKHQTGLQKAGRLIAGLYDKTTEAKDIIDILYDNLPKDKKCKGAKDLSSKAYCVWKNLKHLDVDNAIEDLIWNHLEDKAFGKFFSYGKKSPFGSQLPGGTQPRIELSQRT